MAAAVASGTSATSDLLPFVSSIGTAEGSSHLAWAKGEKRGGSLG